jgi:predicted ester cyclase
MHAFPDVSLRQDTLLIDGDRAVLVGTLSGTDSGGLMGQAPTRRPFSVTVVLVDEFVDGLVMREHRIYDFTGMLVQLGVVKAKPA